ncbi:CPBP family intramembrane metalloprotease [bacterium]|nr:CPBP family intramembrane metalloprotease [bacterium]
MSAPIGSVRSDLSVSRLSLFWLGSLWLAMLHWRWTHLPTGQGYDPTPLWLNRFQQVSVVWLALPLLLMLASLVGALRLGRPRPQDRQAPLARAWVAYLAMHLGAFLWMVPWAWLSPLAQQYAYAVWVGACLWPVRQYLRWRFQPGWWKWSLSAFGLAILGALIYAWVFHPAPSVNGAVPLLLRANLTQKVFWLIQLCLLTPVLEESWYRGLLSGPRPTRLILSALAFGLVHADPSALPQLIWLGLVFGWARWGGGLPAAVLAHALWNGTVAVYLLGA